MSVTTSTTTEVKQAPPAGTLASRRTRALTGVGIGLLLLAGLTWFDAYRLSATYGIGIGPSVSMKLIGTMLGLLGAAHLITAWRSRADSAVPKQVEDHVNHGALAWALGGLIGQIGILMAGGGFILGSTVLFIATARAFGRPLKSFSPVFGIVLSTTVYVFFTEALSLSLPAGPLEQLLLG
jgi:putative tricarboxylic transport membrane protein